MQLADFYRQYRQWPRPNPALVAMYFARRDLALATLPLPKVFPRAAIATVRKSMLCPPPVVHATTDEGEEIALSFYQPKGKPWDYARAEELVTQCLAADVRYGGARRMAIVTKLWITWQGKELPKKAAQEATEKLAADAQRAFASLERLLPFLPPEAAKVRGALFAMAMAS